MKNKKFKVGLIGFGTVGSGVAKILLEDKDILKAKTGIDFELAKIVDLDTTTDRGVKVPDGVLTDDINAILKDESIDVAIELVGGTTIAKTFTENMLKAGKHVVTANKALLAKHGIELYKLAKYNDKAIAFEASCAGGIPVVLALRSGLVANNIQRIYGILNGTCNYILTSMSSKNEDFPVALKKAQELGYAEADPTLDINGGDSAHKLAVLASYAFGYEIEFDDVWVDGIEKVSIEDINWGKKMGYTIKLLGIAEKDNDEMISLRVVPAFVANDEIISQVSGPFNAVSIFGSNVGETMYYGRGAGMLPTASAVVSDIVELALGNSKNTFDALEFKPKEEAQKHLLKIDSLKSRFYIRLQAADKAGVFSKIGDILAKHNISISGVLQQEGNSPENTVPVIITTHLTKQIDVAAAIKALGKLDIVSSEPTCIEIVDIPNDEV